MVLKTKRLLLRPLGMAELDDFVELHDHPEIARFIRQLKRPEAEECLRDVEREWTECGHGMFAGLEAVPRPEHVLSRMLLPVPTRRR